MNIASALNDAYVTYTYVMLFSLFQNNSEEDIHVFLLQKDLTEESKKYLNDLADTFSNEIIYIQMDESDFDPRFLQNHEWPMETCFRLRLNDVIPDDVDRLLYLDGDMIVNKNISTFYETPFEEGKHLVVTHDMTMTPDSDATHGHLHTELFRRMILENAYFNAGMILMDFAFLKEKYHYSDYLHAAEELEFRIFAPDQDLLNYVHREEAQYTDALRYDLFACNAFVYGLDYNSVKKETSVIHYVGEKPWSGGDHFHYDVEHLWWDYALQTVFRERFLDRFIDGVFGNNDFNRAIEKAEEMNRNLSGEETQKRPEYIYPEAEGKESFVREVLSDKRMKLYVEGLYEENDRLQKKMQDSLREAMELLNRLKQ